MSQNLQSLKGMTDLFFEEMNFWQELEALAREMFRVYGYGEIRTPLLEDTQLFARGMGEDTQVVQKEMYTFIDKSGDSVTLRPEGTAGVVRAYVQHSLAARDDVTKLYYMGPMFRHERPQKGRQRQFHQIGCEFFGSQSPLADAEQILMMDELTRALGIRQYDLAINSLGTRAERQSYLDKLVTYFKKYEKDLDDDSRRRLGTNPLRILDSKHAPTQAVCQNAPSILQHLSKESLAHFDAVQNKLVQAGVVFKVDPHVVRGLDYYEHTIFEFTSNDLGAQSAFCGGGRYNSLVEEFGGKSTPGVGFALGCERVILLMMAARTLGDAKKSGVYFVPLDEKSLDACFAHMIFLRSQGVACEMGFELKSLKSQMRRADKLNYRFTAIVGENELAQNAVMLKDMQKGEQKEVAVADLVRILLPSG